MERIYNLLTSFLGESKNDFDNKVYQYQFNCPCCAEQKGVIYDNKYNLEINLKIGKFHCWACGDSHEMKGNISKLIKLYGNLHILKEYKKEIDNILKSKLYDLKLYKDIIINNDEFSLKLPDTFKKIQLNECNNKKLLTYLEKRKINQEIIDKFNIGYTNYNEKNFIMKNRIIIPSYDEIGLLNFWTGRDFTENEKKIKYYNAEIDKKEIIYLESKLNFDADIIIVEGAIDAIYAPNTTALLGKSLKRDSLLYKTLYKKSNAKIIICLDGDTSIGETKKIYNLLNVGRLRNKIYYIQLGTKEIPYKDFGEIYEKAGKIGIIKAIKNKKQFSEIELLIKN